MRYCILLRYNSLYSEVMDTFLSETKISDYIFTNNIDFVNYDEKINKIRPQKSIGLIITVNDNELIEFEKLFNELLSSNNDLKNKIKYFVSPVYKEG
mgnify:CR=1 FL=1